MTTLYITSLVFLVVLCIIVVIGVIIAAISAYDLWKESELKADLDERRLNRRGK